MNTYNGFTKTSYSVPDTGCECLCLIEDEDGNVWYGTRQFDGYFQAFCVEEDETIIAWKALESSDAVYAMLNTPKDHAPTYSEGEE